MATASAFAELTSTESSPSSFQGVSASLPSTTPEDALERTTPQPPPSPLSSALENVASAASAALGLFQRALDEIGHEEVLQLGEKDRQAFLEKIANDAEVQELAQAIQDLHDKELIEAEERDNLLQKLTQPQTFDDDKLEAWVRPQQMENVIEEIRALAETPGITNEEVRFRVALGYQRGGIKGIELTAFDATAVAILEEWGWEYSRIRERFSHLINSETASGLFSELKQEEERVAEARRQEEEAAAAANAAKTSKMPKSYDELKALVAADPEYSVGGACFRVSWRLAAQTSGNSLNSSQVDKSLRGQSLSSLRNAGLAPGDVIYANNSPGADPSSTDLSKEPHWGSVLEILPDGTLLIGDNHGLWTDAEWAAEFGGTRVLDEIFRTA